MENDIKKTTEMNKKVNPLTMLKKALASYDETINIMNKSSLDDENRKTLACAYLNRGDVLQTLGKWENENLEKALLSYDKAIHLAKALPFEITENRKILADAYMKRGNILRVTGTQALETREELAERRQRYSELGLLLQERIENGDAEYDERVGSLLEKELETSL
jgi:tetratricopeptide (TPR) repeat protein